MVTSYSLFPFVNTWENILKKPEDLVFAMNLGSMSELLLDFDRKEIQNKSYEKEVLKLIQKTISENGIETNILRRLKPSSIKALENPIPLQPRTKTYRKYFKTIHDSYHDEKFINSTKIEILDTIDQNNALKLNRCIFYLIRSILNKYSLKHLEQLPKKVFARDFFKIYQNSISNKIVSKSKNSSEHLDLIQHILNETCLGLNHFSSKQKRAKYLEFLHLNYPPWQRDMFYVILNSKNMIKNKKIIQDINTINNSFSSNKIYNAINQKCRKEFVSITETISLKFIQNILHKSLGDHSHEFLRNLSELEFSKELSSIIKSETEKKYTLPEYHNFRYSVANSSYWVFVNSYSDIIFSKIPKSKINKLTTKLLHDFSKFLFNEIRENVLDSRSVDKFELNRIITKFAREVCYEIFENILMIMKKSSKKPITTKIEKSFINELLIHFFKSTYDSSFYQKIPDLSKKQFKSLITSFCKELQKEPQKIRVSCLIGGLSCESKIFQIGNVTFYDPRVWDLGEDIDFDLSSGKPISISENLRTEYSEPYEIVNGYERKRNSARAMVEVMAHDFDSAIEQADVIVQQSVDSLVFASSAFTERGLKSQIPVDYVVIQESNNRSSHNMGPRKLDPDFLKIDEEYLQIAKFHDNFLRESPTKLNNLLYRSLNWYNRGHWSDIPHEKFVLLYIALEQLILGQISGKPLSADLLKYVPKFDVTWRNGFANYGLRIWLNGIIKNMGQKTNLKKFLDKDPRFQGWDSNPSILLENIDAMRPFTKGESRKYVDLILNELTPEKISQIKHDIQINRSLNKFKIALLKSKRNSLIHEAVTYSRELNIMSKELEKILVSVISPLVRFRNKKTLNKIIYEHNRPFQVKNRKY